MASKLEPLFNQVLLKQIKEEERSTGGIYIAGGDKGTQAWRAEVLAVGPGESTKEIAEMPNGDLAFLKRAVEAVAVGDIVYVPAYNGYKVLLGGTEFLLVKDTEILAVVTSDD